jgi:hypothetical protein
MDFQRSSTKTFVKSLNWTLLSCSVFLHSGQLKLFRLNFGEIILLPKITDTES